MRSLAVSFLLLATAAPAPAQVRPVRVSAAVESAAGRNRCEAEAVDAARAKAVLEKASEATRRLLRERLSEHLGRLVESDHRVVGFERVKGGCRVTVDFRVDLGALADLERSLLTEEVPGVPIGVLIRYRVDGRLAAEAGANSRQATNELEAALADYGYDLVSLAAAQGDYDRLLVSREEAFRGADEWSGARRQDDEGGTAASLLEDMREHLEHAAELGPMRECGGLVLFGELRVEDGGLNPYGQGSRASATLILQIHRLDDSRPVVLPANESRQVVGESPGVARDQARAAVLAPVARQIAEELARTPPRKLSRCVGGRPDAP